MELALVAIVGAIVLYIALDLKRSREKRGEIRADRDEIARLKVEAQKAEDPNLTATLTNQALQIENLMLQRKQIEGQRTMTKNIVGAIILLLLCGGVFLPAMTYTNR